ncbi:TolC family protein [Vineibacter terrae]|uniref:TolC family protein n=1 Tax=Vineibacter terrae TaxID=2586908 RepID=UPI002E3257B9|nr:TolC family protein [Vineibacter terrae]HEX2889621.1 TolC family protein [Vineibacter terrae]
MIARRFAIAVASAAVLSGCAQFTPDGGMSAVRDAARGAIAKDVVKITSEDDARRARERVDALLAAPLTSDGAVQVALLNNRGLQAAYNDLGVSEADYVAASLPPNPVVSIARTAGKGSVEIEASIVLNILALFTLPARSEIAAREFSQAQYRTVETTFRLAAETRRAWIRAVAAQELVNYLLQARLSAEAAADLMTRLGETGAASKLDQARAGAFNAEIAVQLAQARLRARTDREALIRALGAWGKDIDFKLPASLPPLPRNLDPATNVEVEAIQRRVDVLMARRELDATAKALGLTQATRYISLLELGGGGTFERSKGAEGTERSHKLGPELGLEIPIFDFGETGVRRAREAYLRSLNRLAEKAVNVRSQARAAQQAYRASYEIARRYQTSVLPLRKTVSDEALLRYNGMLIDVFELLTTVRESIASSMAAIEARRDFLLADVDFQTAIIGGGAGSGGSGESAAPAATSAAAH